MTNEDPQEPHRRSRQSSDDAGQEELQKRMDEETDKGYSGTVPDPTPNENYTVGGNDLPTPETDPKLAREARDAALDVEEKNK